MPVWDLVISIAILFTAFVTPFEVSFLPMTTTPMDALFVLNRFIDGIFVVDMALNFVLVYARGDEAAGEDIFFEERPVSCITHVHVLNVAPQFTHACRC